MAIYIFSEECKANARRLITSAIAKKQIIPPRHCEICLYDISMIYEEEPSLSLRGKTKCHTKQVLEAHHYNYNFPLNVWWLCPSCHKILHVAQRHYQIACISLSSAKDLVTSSRYDYEHVWINDIDDESGKYDDLFFL